MERVKEIASRAGALAEGLYFVFGVLLLKWSPMLMAAGYWIQEATMFAVTAVALVYIKLKNGGKVFLGRYLFIYGFFFFGHTIFFLILAALTSGADSVSDEIIDGFFNVLRGYEPDLPPEINSSLAITFIIVLATVVYSVAFRVKSASGNPAVLINRAFGAIIAPHFLIIFGGGGIMLTGAPYALAVVLVAIKILFDMTGFSARGTVIVSDDEVEN